MAAAGGAPVSTSVTRPLTVNVPGGGGVGDTGSVPPHAKVARQGATTAFLASMTLSCRIIHNRQTEDQIADPEARAADDARCVEPGTGFGSARQQLLRRAVLMETGDNASVKPRLAAAVAAVFALAVFHTWPLPSAPGRLSLNYNADAQLTAWTVSWFAHALPVQPLHLFAGNIFQPDNRAVAYSEPLFIQGVAGAPVRWLGGSAVLTFNLLLIAGLAATALAGWWLVWCWTGSFAAAVVGGALMAFNVHLLTRLPHLQAAHAWGLVAVVLVADRLARGSARGPLLDRTTVLLATLLASVAMTSEYWLFFAAVVVFVIAVAGVRSLRAAGRLALASAIGAAIAMPVLLPYIRLGAEGVRRPLAQAAQFAATPAGYLVSTSRVHASWGRHFYTSDVNAFFPGVCALVLASIGCWSAARAGGDARRRALVLVALAVIGVVLSLGPATSIYAMLYRVFVPLQGLRAAARFGFLFLIAIACLAGFGVAAIERRLPSRAAAVAFGVLALAAVTAEAWQGPVRTIPFTGVPPIYARLLDVKTPVLLAEMPFWPPQALFENGEYVLNATGYWIPTMNGYAGYTPEAYRRRAASFWFFPRDWAIAAMKKEGVTHVMVHLERFGRDADDVVRELAPRKDLELLASDSEGHRLYRLLP